MKLSQLAKKYPKAWKQYYLSKQCEGFFADDDIREYWSYITDFMDKQGIIIALNVDVFNDLFIGKIYRAYKEFYEWEYEAETDDCKSRKQAETQVICKAFEILEGRIKK